MNKLKQFVPERILYSLYCSLVLPYINYGVIVWGNTCKTYLVKIHKLQKWAMRVISNSHYVYDMYKLETGVFMYKYSTGSLPDGFNNCFTMRSEIHNYQTRSKGNYHLTNNIRVFSDHSVRTFGHLFWNSLHNNINKSNSIKHFRKQLKKLLVCVYE